MIRRLIAISAVIALVSTFGVVSHAQSFGNSGSRGMSGGMGGSAFGGGGSGFGGMGSSGFGGMGSSGFGGMGSSGFGGGGMGGGMGSSGFGSSGFGGGNSGFGNSGFGNSGAGGQQNFVGRDGNDMQATFGQLGKASTQFFNNMNRNMRNTGNSRRSNKKTVQNASQPARVEMKVAFDPPRPSSDQMARDIRTRLTKLLAANHMSQPTVSMEGDTVVLSGSAASENERDVISQLLAIEPGVRDVRNEMTIGKPAAAPSGIAPSPGS